MPVAAAGLIAVLGAAASPDAEALVSGTSYQLVLGVDPETKVITGYYESYTGRNAQFSCIFFLRGEAKGEPPYRVRTWYPADEDDSDAIDGEIWPEDDGVMVQLKEEHGGCWNVQHFADEGGTGFASWEKGAWRGVRVVASEKAYFHDKPDEAARRKAYLVTGNPLRVFKTTPGWVDGEYEGYSGAGKKVVTKGWIRERDLFRDTPPPPARPRAK